MDDGTDGRTRFGELSQIDLGAEKGGSAWEKTSLRFKNIRVTMNHENFASCRLKLME